MLLAGIDIGGTFTDLAVYDAGRCHLTVHKVPSTPEDPGRALVDGIVALCERAGVTPEMLDVVLHGTTVATNAVLEHCGALTGMVTTDGFRDVVHIGRHQRPQAYSVMQDIPWQAQPFARRAHRIAVPGRLVPPAGEEVVPLDEDAVRRAGRQLRAGGVEAVAVCFLFSYLDPRHEQRAAEVLREEMPGCFITTSAAVSPQFREFERFTTACMNAFVGPGTGRYLERLSDALAARGVRAPLLVMMSNGGVAAVRSAAAQPVSLMLSGPAAGVLGGQWAASLAGRERLITFDMGGTSADIGIVTEAGPAEASARDTQIAGYPLLVPMFDIQTIGAGGGSIAFVDEGGAFRVGPRSAGAIPGPAAYGHGGEQPTITDAHLVLGRLAPDRFLGGEMALDPAASARVIDGLAREIGLDRRPAAEGVLQIANANMAQTVRSITVERGHDPRTFSLVAFGGAGPLHAAEVAEMLGVPEVLVPPNPGITSAAGLLASDLRYDQMQTVFALEGSADLQAIEARLVALSAELTQRLRDDGVGAQDITVTRALDCRYLGQGYELRVVLGDQPVGPEAFFAFHRAHEREYAHRFEDPVEIVNLRVTATGSRPPLSAAPVSSGTLEAATVDIADGIWRWEGELATLPTRYLERARLPVGEAIEGPAIVLQPDTTVAVPPGWCATAHPDGPLLLTRAGAQAATPSEEVADALCP